MNKEIIVVINNINNLRRVKDNLETTMEEVAEVEAAEVAEEEVAIKIKILSLERNKFMKSIQIQITKSTMLKILIFS